MDAVLKWIGIVGAAWMLLSILAGVAWALGGKRIFRKPPVQPTFTIVARDDSDAVLKAISDEVRRNVNGRGY